MESKKNPKAEVGRRSMLFFQIGMVLMLLVAWMAVEWKSYDKREADTSMFNVDDELVEEIPITNQLTPPPPPPPPPPAPEVIEVVEDEVEIEETVIKSTETKPEEKIAKVADIVVVKEEVIEDVPFAVIENVPIYPGCEGEKTNQAKKDCMSEKIQKFVSKKFNTELANDLGLEGIQQIYVQFKIDKNGDITDVRARAPHPRLEKEAKDVINALPKMTPGKQRGKAVGVLYALPIKFQIEN